MMRRLAYAIALVAALCILTTFALGGSAPFGRLALALGMPGLAGEILPAAAWQGVAAYSAGDFDDAADHFDADEDGDFNAGVALARAGRFAAALEAFDRAMARYPDDTRAEANFDLISSIYAGTGVDPDAFVDWSGTREGVDDEGFVGEGSARAASTGDQVTNSGANMGLPEITSQSNRIGIRKVFDDSFMIANERWLQTLADVPGEYLAARIAEEHKRRKAAGILQPEAEDPQ